MENKRSIFDDSDDSDVDDPSPQKHVKSDIKNSEKNKEPNDILITPEKQVGNSEKSPDILITPEKHENTDAAKEKLKLTPSQLARIERNRQQALLLRRAKMNKRLPPKSTPEKEGKKVVRINDTKLIDTGAGFYVEEGPTDIDENMEAAIKLVSEPAPLFEEDRPHCIECSQPFNNSFLHHTFDFSVCDHCRDNEDRHMLMTKTDAKNEYLLKDCDFELRKPTLKFIVRKNPHNPRWGDMKLYLKPQIEKRALEVWGTEEAIEEEILKKEEQKEVSKQKKYSKKMQELRMNVRSSLYTRASKTHEHEYGPEEYDAEADEYSKTCATCNHSYTFDKM